MYPLPSQSAPRARGGSPVARLRGRQAPSQVGQRSHSPGGLARRKSTMSGAMWPCFLPASRSRARISPAILLEQPPEGGVGVEISRVPEFLTQGPDRGSTGQEAQVLHPTPMLLGDRSPGRSGDGGGAGRPGPIAVNLDDLGGRGLPPPHGPARIVYRQARDGRGRPFVSSILAGAGRRWVGSSGLADQVGGERDVRAGRRLIQVVGRDLVDRLGGRRDRAGPRRLPGFGQLLDDLGERQIRSGLRICLAASPRSRAIAGRSSCRRSLSRWRSRNRPRRIARTPHGRAGPWPPTSISPACR